MKAALVPLSFLAFGFFVISALQPNQVAIPKKIQTEIFQESQLSPKEELAKMEAKVR